MENYFWLWILMGLVFYLISLEVAHKKGRESWKFMNDRYKKALELARFKICELADGLGGKCEKCKGYGVLGEDGNTDCWDCGGTGLHSLRDFRFDAITHLEQQEKQANAFIKRIKEAKEKLSEGKKE
jgi:hypothetical protein